MNKKEETPLLVSLAIASRLHMNDGIVSDDDGVFVSVERTVLFSCSLDFCRSSRRFFRPKGSSRSKSSSSVVWAPNSTVACRLGAEELEDVGLEDEGVTGWREWVEGPGVSGGAKCMLFEACGSCRGVDKVACGRWPAAAFVRDEGAAVCGARDLFSARGAFRRPRRFTPTQGESPVVWFPSWSPALASVAERTERCLESRLAWSRRFLASLVSGPKTGRSISRMAASFLDFAISLRRLYSARCRCVVNLCAVCSSSSSTIRYWSSPDIIYLSIQC